uniref:Uncharacterized protein n=1 Tax=Rhizophora mucronata TaxID=61149 RepID=A0A2P2N0U9_RHIMU
MRTLISLHGIERKSQLTKSTKMGHPTQNGGLS